MKIILSGNGFIDPVNTFAETSKIKLLKNIIVLSRDRYYIARLDKKINVIDYSGTAAEAGESQRETEQRMLRRMKPRLADMLRRAGDVLYISGCEPSELAALPVIQEVCEENDLRFHAFLIAPFLFQGKRPAENMSDMLASLKDTYSSVSLYYADELLRIDSQERKNKDGGVDFDPYTMQNAFDVLEKAVVDIAKEMYRQIPKLDRGMQYTYDFNWEQFSLALDPLSLIRDMWQGVVTDRSLFPKAVENDQDSLQDTGSPESVARPQSDRGDQGRKSLLSSVDTGKLARIVGILDPDHRNKKSTSAYSNVKKNTIPMTVFREQVGESKINDLVERIRTHVATNGRYEDPAFRKKAEERLLREIRKFQVRQEAAERKFNGQQPTEFLSEEEALSSVYMDDLAESAAAPSGDERTKDSQEMSMATPFQRAARNATLYKERPKSWAEISREKQSDKPEGAGAPADQAGYEGAETGDRPVKSPEKHRFEPYETEKADVPEHVSDGRIERDEKEVLAPSKELWSRFAGLDDKEKAEQGVKDRTQEENGSLDHKTRPDAADEGPEKQAGQAETQDRAIEDKAGIGGIMDFTFRHTDDVSRKSQTIRPQEEPQSAGIYTERSVSSSAARSGQVYDRGAERARRRAEKQAAKINRRLAKAEEKAAAAAAKAAQAKLEVEIIAREKER